MASTVHDPGGTEAISLGLSNDRREGRDEDSLRRMGRPGETRRDRGAENEAGTRIKGVKNRAEVSVRG